MEETKEFKWAVRVILKRQLRNLLSQLEEAGEEVAVMAASVEDRTCSHFGTAAGEGFMSEQQQFTNNFLQYCIKLKKRPGLRSLMMPDEFSHHTDGTERKTRSGVKAETLVETAGKQRPAKRLSADAKASSPKRSKVEETSSSSLSTRSGRKISAKYLDSIRVLSKGSKKQTKAVVAPRDSVTEEEQNGVMEQIEDKNPSGDDGEDDKSMIPVYNDAEGVDAADDYVDSPEEEDDEEENLTDDADLDYKPIKVVSAAKPANFKSVEEKIIKLSIRRKQGKKSILERTMMDCEHCGVQIKGRTNLKTHIRRVHLQEKNHKCLVCQTPFFTSTSLENHKLSVHTRKCDSCGEYVVEVEPWKEGINNRSRRLVACSCGADVLVFSAYGRAANIAEESDQPQGDLDTSRTEQKYDRGKNHDAARYACATCGKIFMKRYLCLRHSRRHSDSMPLVCDVCGKSFRYENSLKKHLEKEHGILKMVCTICGKSCSNESTMKVHMSKMHSRGMKVQLAQTESQDIVVQDMTEDASVSSLEVVQQQVEGTAASTVESETVGLIVSADGIIPHLEPGSMVTVISTETV